MGEGLDNIAYEVDGELIVRFSKAAGSDREARLLTVVAGLSPVPVPTPIFADAARGCLAYRKLPGTSLLDLPWPQRSGCAAPLNRLLEVLHAAPVSLFEGLVEEDDLPGGEWLSEAAEFYAEVAAIIPAVFHGRIEAFLAAPPPAGGYELVFSHNDLGAEHVLVDDSGAVTGILDWSDAAFADPAYDFALLLRDLGPAAIRPRDDIAERALFYARCSVLEDLAYGVDRYVRNGLAALEWLFPVQGT
ncbi:aminoglycoside phosphotransferase family protein [Actinoplanes bogorensis]|uniref:Aminoglycoside phosphotransferase family protein n=1 Tax=Paractinoplanes bogorensis TaxID=1610840 RepID=A0ABS5YSG2_9ACTN|nr:aminoglycoside phosphotransferase family protein [Actinoplanes bogorensis]